MRGRRVGGGGTGHSSPIFRLEIDVISGQNFCVKGHFNHGYLTSPDRRKQ